MSIRAELYNLARDVNAIDQHASAADPRALMAWVIETRSLSVLNVLRAARDGAATAEDVQAAIEQRKAELAGSV